MGQNFSPAAQEKTLCPWCMKPQSIIWVHGHGQCAHCGINSEPCCDGGCATNPLAADEVHQVRESVAG